MLACAVAMANLAGLFMLTTILCCHAFACASFPAGMSQDLGGALPNMHVGPGLTVRPENCSVVRRVRNVQNVSKPFLCHAATNRTTPFQRPVDFRSVITLKRMMAQGWTFCYKSTEVLQFTLQRTPVCCAGTIPLPGGGCLVSTTDRAARPTGRGPILRPTPTVPATISPFLAPIGASGNNALNGLLSGVRYRGGQYASLVNSILQGRGPVQLSANRSVQMPGPVSSLAAALSQSGSLKPFLPMLNTLLNIPQGRNPLSKTAAQITVTQAGSNLNPVLPNSLLANAFVGPNSAPPFSVISNLLRSFLHAPLGQPNPLFPSTSFNSNLGRSVSKFIPLLIGMLKSRLNDSRSVLATANLSPSSSNPAAVPITRFLSTIRDQLPSPSHISRTDYFNLFSPLLGNISQPSAELRGLFSKDNFKRLLSHGNTNILAFPNLKLLLSQANNMNGHTRANTNDLLDNINRDDIFLNSDVQNFLSNSNINSLLSKIEGLISKTKPPSPASQQDNSNGIQSNTSPISDLLSDSSLSNSFSLATLNGSLNHILNSIFSNGNLSFLLPSARLNTNSPNFNLQALLSNINRNIFSNPNLNTLLTKALLDNNLPTTLQAPARPAPLQSVLGRALSLLSNNRPQPASSAAQSLGSSGISNPLNMARAMATMLLQKLPSKQQRPVTMSDAVGNSFFRQQMAAFLSQHFTQQLQRLRQQQHYHTPQPHTPQKAELGHRETTTINSHANTQPSIADNSMASSTKTAVQTTSTKSAPAGTRSTTEVMTSSRQPDNKNPSVSKGMLDIIPHLRESMSASGQERQMADMKEKVKIAIVSCLAESKTNVSIAQITHTHNPEMLTPVCRAREFIETCTMNRIRHDLKENNPVSVLGRTMVQRVMTALSETCALLLKVHKLDAGIPEKVERTTPYMAPPHVEVVTKKNKIIIDNDSGLNSDKATTRKPSTLKWIEDIKTTVAIPAANKVTGVKAASDPRWVMLTVVGASASILLGSIIIFLVFRCRKKDKVTAIERQPEKLPLPPPENVYDSNATGHVTPPETNGTADSLAGQKSSIPKASEDLADATGSETKNTESITV